ncbi:MAG: HIT domain-containing protein [Candidatus Electryonea clarkiae]|nr:HIT domain-containing protein [Candidatus Electryonea clarkiae]MDP8285731.1 HIT domain-containing protein [Candidatus Electryonea clarkiae]
MESKNGVKECFICDAFNAPEKDDRKNLILVRGSNSLIIMNRFPYSNGHLMICPIRHISDLRAMEPDEWKEIGLLTQKSIEALERTITPHGFNLGWNIGQISGAGLEQHIHQHIVPRWSGDTNFMPVVGKAKVISQDLWESYDQLKEIIIDL